MDLDNGIIPLLEFPDGNILTESSIIEDFAEEYSYKGSNLYPSDAYQRAKLRVYITEFSSYFPLFFAMWKDRGQKEESLKQFKDALVKMEKLFN